MIVAVFVTLLFSSHVLLFHNPCHVDVEVEKVRIDASTRASSWKASLAGPISPNLCSLEFTPFKELNIEPDSLL